MSRWMKPYKVVIAYDGTGYHGWQEQKNIITVAGLLQARFKKVFGQEIKLVGASRTDTGVHALGQVARFYSDRIIDPLIMQRSWNSSLPPDIHIRALEYAPENFHSQHNVIEKTYYYHFFTQLPLPFIARYGLYYRFPLDYDKFKESLDLFVGTHDFRLFCADNNYDTTIRTINFIKLEYLQKYRAYRIIVKGPSFLRYMIRRIVGSSLEIAASKNRSIHEIADALQERKSSYQFPTAGAHGLLLRKVTYERNLL